MYRLSFDCIGISGVASVAVTLATMACLTCIAPASALSLRRPDLVMFNVEDNMGCLSATVSSVPTSQVCRAEILHVELACGVNRSSSGSRLGLILQRQQTYTDTPSHPPVFVSYIERDSPADLCGAIQVGDRVLAIDDYCTSAGSAEEANTRLRRAKGTVRLLVEYDVIETVLPSCGLFAVKLAKRGESLGIELQQHNRDVKGEPILVRSVQPGSVAFRSGSLMPGDQLIAIDNIPLQACSVTEAIRLLERAGDVVTLCIRRLSHTLADAAQQDIAYTVELNRNGGALGITIAGTDDPADPVTISQLQAGSIAQKTGAIHSGDRLLAINGRSLSNCNIAQAIALLQQSGDVVSLRIGRSVQLRSEALLGQNDSTPIQSIDSAIDSLEGSAPDISSGCEARRLNPRSSCPCIWNQEFQRRLAAGASQTETAQWLNILDALSNVGEEEMLNRLEAQSTTECSYVNYSSVPSTSATTVRSPIPAQPPSTPNRSQRCSMLQKEGPVKPPLPDIPPKPVPQKPVRRRPTVEVHRVFLSKDDSFNDFGFSVADSANEMGCFIRAVRDGGPAHLSGDVRPFDRLLQVDSTDVQRQDCLLVVPLLANAGERVELLLCRDEREPTTSHPSNDVAVIEREV